MNSKLDLMGGKLVGVGLAMSIEDRDSFVASHPSNAAVLRPYIGGEDVNSRPDASFSRYMIDFSTKTLEEAAQWPELLQLIEALVKRARMTDKRGTYRTYWWRPGESGGALCAANVTTHLLFTFQPTTPCFSQTLYVFPLDRWSPFAVLQSRIHEAWARLLSSSLEDRLRYAASDCFETFPFPQPDPRALIPALESMGEQLYQARAKYMLETDQGLTKTYNALKDPSEADPASSSSASSTRTWTAPSSPPTAGKTSRSPPSAPKPTKTPPPSPPSKTK